MIPNQYSDNICSFIEHEKRYAVSIIYKIMNQYPYECMGNPIVRESIVRNQKAYSYEEYDELYALSRNNFYTISSFFFKKEITDSHKLVEYWMIYTNQTIAKYMTEKHQGQCILRVHSYTEPGNQDIDDKLRIYLNQKETKSAKYEYFHSIEQTNNQTNNHTHTQTHSICNDLYTHFTSPIRRSVDFWNHLVLRNIVDSNEKIDLEMIDSFMKKTKKLERDSKRIQILNHLSLSKHNTHHIYDAYVLDIIRNETNAQTKLKIYIPELDIEDKIILIHPTILKEIYENDCNINDCNINKYNYTLYQKIKVNIYLFKDADILFQKIRWRIYS
jgi:exoribonuclease R